MQRRIRQILCLSLSLLFAFAMIGCSGTPSQSEQMASESATEAEATQQKVIKIGVMVPLTGNNTQAGTEIKALVSLFEKAINEKVEINLPFHDVEGLPNLDGAKVEYVYGDMSTPDIAMSEAERLITEEGVIALTGIFSSASTKTAMVPAEKYGVVLLSVGSSDSLAEAGYKYFGRTWPGDGKFVTDTFEYLKKLNETKNAGIKTVTLISEDSEFGTNIGRLEKEAAEKYGFEILENISYSSSASNVTSEVLRLKNADADVVIMSSALADGLLLMSTMKEQNYYPKMVFGQRGAFALSDFIANLGEDSDYCFTTARWNGDFTNPIVQEVASTFKEEYSGGIDLFPDVLGTAWDAYLLAIIANQAGSTDADAMRTAMSEGVVVDPEQDPSGMPGYKYGESGQNELTSAFIVQIMDNANHTVYPYDLAAREGVYPAPSWDER